ncbi:MAG TPA: GIY-YIG nuclease family protein [Puia sp.]|nr:GIY-YIG nuclease family protein [Puia sp.]
MRPVYYFYITTNPSKTVLYCGMTNSLDQRIVEHYLDRGTQRNFAGKYSCFYLLYYESFQYINDAIDRETEVKKWSRKKKEQLIQNMNAEWKFLNVELYGEWPPRDLFHRRDIK